MSKRIFITSGWGQKTIQYGTLFLVLFFLSLPGFLIGSQFEGVAVMENGRDRK
jgi:hypothetical protein